MLNPDPSPPAQDDKSCEGVGIGMAKAYTADPVERVFSIVK